MISNHKKKPVVVIAGPTASGKSAIALKLAAQYRGEIIAADSRTIYKGMDIGTAKPTASEMAAIPHHGIDMIDPDETFSAAEFQRYAKAKIREIHKRGNLPLIVGGTGLYTDGLVYDFSFASKPNEALRKQIEAMDLHQLLQKARELGIDEGEVNFANPRHLGRAIERDGEVVSRKKLPPNYLYIGLTADKERLHERIVERVDKMFADGLVSEVQNLIKKFGSEAPGLLAPGYKAVVEHLNGSIDIKQAKELFIRNDKQLAKRQITWFKRNPDIVWCGSEHEVVQVAGDFLAKFDTINS